MDQTVRAHEAKARAPPTPSSLRPFDWYLALVVAGTVEHTLDPIHQAQIMATPYRVDENNLRKSRVDALKVLQDHGHTDHMALLAS